MTDHLSEVNPKEYPLLSNDELRAELASVSGRLSGAYGELSQVKIQYAYIFYEGYKHSGASSVIGRDRDGEIAGLPIKEDEERLVGNIESLKVLRDLLNELLHAC